MDNPIVLFFGLISAASIIIATGISLANALLYFSKKIPTKNNQYLDI